MCIIVHSFRSGSKESPLRNSQENPLRGSREKLLTGSGERVVTVLKLEAGTDSAFDEPFDKFTSIVDSKAKDFFFSECDGLSDLGAFGKLDFDSSRSLLDSRCSNQSSSSKNRGRSCLSLDTETHDGRASAVLNDDRSSSVFTGDRSGCASWDSSDYTKHVFETRDKAVKSTLSIWDEPLESSLNGTKSLKKQMTNHIYEIQNKSGQSCRMQHIMSEKGVCARGRFSEVYEMVDELPQLISGISNKEIVVKMLREEQLLSTRACPFTAEEKILFSLEQFKFLEKYFKEKREENPPIVPIYNLETAVSCGYTVVKKVKPLKEALWDKKVAFDNLSPEQKKYYDTLVKLLEANKALEKAEKPQMDLKLDNLGMDGEHLVLLDYVNIPFYLSSFLDSYPSRLSMGNIDVERKLEEVEKLFTLI